MDYMFHCASVINIPAYDASNNGLIIDFKLTATSHDTLLINTRGKVAEALQGNLKRIIDIMSSLNTSWHCLKSVHYLLECEHDQFLVRDSKSSSMALSIALINIHRSIQGHAQILGLTGTGVLRIDGSFDNAHQHEKKYSASKKFKTINKFITPNESNNLFELEHLMNQL